MTADQPSRVSLVLPTDCAYLGVARLSASGVAALHQFDIAQIDDIKTAVSEACYYLIGLPVRAPELCVIYLYSRESETLCVRIDPLGGACVFADGHVSDPSIVICVLETLVDKAEITTREDGMHGITMIMRRVAGPEPRDQ